MCPTPSKNDNLEDDMSLQDLEKIFLASEESETKIEKMERQNEELRSKLISIEKELAEYKNQDKIRKSLQSKSELVEISKDEIEKLNNQIKVHEKVIKTLNSNIEALTNKNFRLTAELREYSTPELNLMDQNKSLKLEVQNLKNKFDKIKMKLDVNRKFERELKQAQEKLAKFSSLEKEFQNIQEKLKIAENNNDISKLKIELETQKQAFRDLIEKKDIELANLNRQTKEKDELILSNEKLAKRLIILEESRKTLENDFKSKLVAQKATLSHDLTKEFSKRQTEIENRTKNEVKAKEKEISTLKKSLAQYQMNIVELSAKLAQIEENNKLLIKEKELMGEKLNNLEIEFSSYKVKYAEAIRKHDLIRSIAENHAQKQRPSKNSFEIKLNLLIEELRQIEAKNDQASNEKAKIKELKKKISNLQNFIANS